MPPPESSNFNVREIRIRGARTDAVDTVALRSEVEALSCELVAINNAEELSLNTIARPAHSSLSKSPCESDASPKPGVGLRRLLVSPRLGWRE